MDSNSDTVPFQAYRRNYTDVYIDQLIHINQLTAGGQGMHMMVELMGEAVSEFFPPDDPWRKEWDDIAELGDQGKISPAEVDKRHYRLCWRAFIQRKILVRGGHSPINETGRLQGMTALTTNGTDEAE